MMTHEEWRRLRQPTQPPLAAVTPIPLTPAQKHGFDSDRLLVLALAVILWQNGAAIELILALLYIAM